MDSLQTKEHVTDYLFSMAANEMRLGMARTHGNSVEGAIT